MAGRAEWKEEDKGRRAAGSKTISSELLDEDELLLLLLRGVMGCRIRLFCEREKHAENNTCVYRSVRERSSSLGSAQHRNPKADKVMIMYMPLREAASEYEGIYYTRPQVSAATRRFTTSPKSSPRFTPVPSTGPSDALLLPPVGPREDLAPL